MPSFPLHHSDSWNHPNGFHMVGDAYLTQQGQLRADITTQTTSWGLGFTGGCIIPVIDAQENVLHRWLIWPLGVDARSVWWKPSKRTDHPEEYIDPAVAAQADRLELWFGHMPKDRWDDILNEVRDKADNLKKLFQDLLG
jgi:hypothetical protein